MIVKYIYDFTEPFVLNGKSITPYKKLLVDIPTPQALCHIPSQYILHHQNLDTSILGCPDFYSLYTCLVPCNYNTKKFISSGLHPSAKVILYIQDIGCTMVTNITMENLIEIQVPIKEWVDAIEISTKLLEGPFRDKVELIIQNINKDNK